MDGQLNFFSLHLFIFFSGFPFDVYTDSMIGLAFAFLNYTLANIVCFFILFYLLAGHVFRAGIVIRLPFVALSKIPVHRLYIVLRILAASPFYKGASYSRLPFLLPHSQCNSRFTP